MVICGIFNPRALKNVQVFQPPAHTKPRPKPKIDYKEQDTDADDADNDDDAFEDEFNPADYSDEISDEDEPFLNQNSQVDINNNNLNESCSKLRGLSVADEADIVDLTSSSSTASPSSNVLPSQNASSSSNVLPSQNASSSSNALPRSIASSSSNVLPRSIASSSSITVTKANAQSTIVNRVNNLPPVPVFPTPPSSIFPSQTKPSSIDRDFALNMQ